MLPIWEDFLHIIKEEAGSQVVETWFKAVTLHEWDVATNSVYLKAPNQFVSTWVQEHYSDLMSKHLSRLLHADSVRVVFTSTGDQTPRTIIPASMIPFKHDGQAPSQQKQATELAVQTPAGKPALIDKKPKDRGSCNINESYLFESFVAGPSNSLAQAAAYAICENIGKVYNPLFIYGGTGLGKTHLLHAIANEVRKRNPSLIVRYETSDHFINEFINCIRFDRSQQFRHKYQKVDVLLFDDIQFLSNKEQTQETFFHIFNTLYEHQRQIVLSSDTFPKEIAGLQSRLKSRMEWGLIADIQMPDLETKIAILKKKAGQHNINLADDVADFIASRVLSNIRELEGALIRVSAFAALTNQPITLEMARKVLLNLQEKKCEGASLENILKIVCKHYSISVNEVKAKSRQKDVSSVRQVALYMMKKHSFASLQVIGNFVGGRNHSTVIHALTKIEHLCQEDALFAQKLKTIDQEIAMGG
ncbi:MAG: chromosomal replication initiator protein DnaA [Candidatus Babeliales bacterium]